MKILKINLLLFVFVISSYGQNKVGTTAADFLTIPVGPRATAMGGAYVANANDVSAAYWNPGALSRLKQSEFNATYADWILDTQHNWVGLVLVLDENNAFAVSLNQMDYGQEEITTELDPQGTGQFWDASDLSIGISYSRNLTDRFSIGGTFKYISTRIWNESASAFAIDMGLLFTTELNGLRLGMNISNFGTEMQLDGPDLFQPIDIDESNFGNNPNIAGKLETDTWDLPLNFAVGIAMDFINNEEFYFTVGTDAIYPINTTPYVNIGTEVAWRETVFIRAGYHSLFEEDSEEGLSAGIGLKYEISGFKLGVDYSFADFGQFDSISRYGINIQF
ncbi:MAG: PorV/PorQ family protein [Melioribacteraceae bacterium]|nr:PorV/PorQ family protein [Melioribacteraceae bacterium]